MWSWNVLFLDFGQVPVSSQFAGARCVDAGARHRYIPWRDRPAKSEETPAISWTAAAAAAAAPTTGGCACHCGYRQQTCLLLPFWHKKYGVQVLSTVVCWPGKKFDLKQSIARPSLTNLTKGVGNNTTVSSRCCHKVLETTPLCLPGAVTKRFPSDGTGLWF